MKSTGIPRKVDDLGRIVVPVEFRRLLNIHEGDELEVTVEGGRLVLTRVDPACALCGGTTELHPFRDRHVCATCLGELPR